jgi:DNA repair protein RecN (Recombination protein N)
LLYEGSASTSSSLRTAQKHIEELSRYEPKFQEALAAIETARISVEDVGATLRDYAGGIQASPEHLAEVEDRLAVMDRLKRKYGPTLDDVIHHGEEVSRKLSEMENKDEILAQLRAALAQAAQEYLRSARAISKKRYEAARKLEKLVETEINDLAMKSNFHIEVSGTDEAGNWTASGFDEVVYLISTNPGEPLRRLEHIASGGELSRVMLAVGKKLKALSRANQVLCVTHLPQIATFADHHYVIEKKTSADRTRTAVRLITGEERTEEVARMLSGAKLTDTSRKHAEQMLKTNA